MQHTTTHEALSSICFEKIKRLDTCLASNAIERLKVRLRNEGAGVSGSALHCLFPNFKPMLGYAATGRMRYSTAPVKGRAYHENIDWWRYVASLPEPRIMVVQDVDETPGGGALVGELHAVIGLALHCVGYVTNGSVRDLPGVKATGFHLFAGGVAVSHQYAHITEFGKPVEIGGLSIQPGDLIHGDCHGVHQIPLSIAPDIPAMASEILNEELELKELCRSRLFSLTLSRRSWRGCPATASKCRLDRTRSIPLSPWGAIPLAALAGLLAACSGQNTQAQEPVTPVQGREVGVIKAVRKTLQRQLTVSSELAPFQQIDVYAKESGYVKELSVDYGSHVRTGQVMAVLEIPELRLQLEQDDAAIAEAADQVERARNEVGRVGAQHDVLHLQFDRLNGVAKTEKGLVAQQEVDDAHGRDLAAESQLEGARSALASSQSQLTRGRANRRRDQALFDYSKIVAPFDGVVTQRYANLGTLVQSGTNSSTQAMPLVQLSQENLFRLVIPVSESYVRYIRIGDPVDVSVPSLEQKLFRRPLLRFSVDVKADTRTMHTEVDVPNRDGSLMPGLYAEAKLTLDRRNNVVAVPLEAVNIEGDERTVPGLSIRSSNKVEKRKITIGVETAKDAEVTQRLERRDQGGDQAIAAVSGTGSRCAPNQ